MSQQSLPTSTIGKGKVLTRRSFGEFFSRLATARGARTDQMKSFAFLLGLAVESRPKTLDSFSKKPVTGSFVAAGVLRSMRKARRAAAYLS